jgi:hypothetical protein
MSDNQPAPCGGQLQQAEAPQGVPPQTPAPGGGKRKAGIFIGSIAVLAVIGMSVFFTIGGSGDSHIADDGAHKLSAPRTILDGRYKRVSAQSDSLTENEIKEFESWGVHDPRDVTAVYTTESGITTIAVTVSGFYGTIDDPERAVDAMYAKLKAQSEKDSGHGKLVGSLKEFKPSDFENGIMKCQQTETIDVVTKTYAFCIWGDHSTLSYVTSYDPVSLGAVSWNSTSLEDAADLTAKVRKDVRVRA